MNTKLLALLALALPLIASAQPVTVPSPFLAKGFACEPLEYPVAALRAEATGRTVISFTVSDDGFIVQPEVKASSGRKREHKLLDFVALQHVRSCKLASSASMPPGEYSHEFVWVIR